MNKLSICLQSATNSLWPSDAIWWQISGWTLAHVMACCLIITNSVDPHELLPGVSHLANPGMCNTTTTTDGTRPLPQPMLTNRQSCLVTFASGRFHKKCLRYISLNVPLKIITLQGSTLSFLAGCPKIHFLGWYRNFLVYWYLILDNQVVNSTCPKDKLGWIWRADEP